jgi:hypothetical protein
MEFFFKTALPFLLNFLLVLCVMALQLIFFQVNLLGIYLYEKLYDQKNIMYVIALAIIASLMFDSIKMSPLGLWIFSYFLGALPVVITTTVAKINIAERDGQYTSEIIRICLITISSFIQTVIYNRLSNINSIDFKQLFSIVAISVVYVVLIRLVRKKNSSSLIS